MAGNDDVASQMQKGVVIVNPGPAGVFEVRDDLTIPRPKDDEVLVKLECTGLCGSETRAQLGWSKYQSIVGHEGVGRVVALGPDVPADLQHLLGVRVGIKWVYSACGVCSRCRGGNPNYCPKQRNTGREVDGTLQQYAIAQPQWVSRIPDEISSEVAAPLLCAGLTMMGAVDKLDRYLATGDWVVITGAGGGLGHLGVQIAVQSKGYKVISIDTGAARRQLCLELGSTAFVDFVTDDPVQEIQKITGGEGADAVIAVSGNELSYAKVPKLVRNMGVIVPVGLPKASHYLPMSTVECAARGIIVDGCAVGNEAQMEALFELVKCGKVTPKIEVFELDHAPQVLGDIKDGKIVGRAVVKLSAS